MTSRAVLSKICSESIVQSKGRLRIYMKIVIIGNCGSGKSTLALALHTLLGIPLYHLDQYFWKPGWQASDHLAFKETHNRLCDQDQWIIDGAAVRIFEYRLQRTDIVIFIDMPTYICLYRVFKRAYMHRGSVYFSSATGCQERYPDFTFFRYIATFNYYKRPIINDLLKKYAYHKQIFIIKNQEDINELIKKLATNKDHNKGVPQ